jgi:cysteine desulfurase
VLEAVLPFLQFNFANPSSAHHFSQSINENVKQAREQIADYIKADSNELIFTSGATEAITIAIKGITESYSSEGKHIVTVSTEHKAVLNNCKELERKDFAVTHLPVLKNGLIDLYQLEKAIRANTILVSVMYVNNETAVNQPIRKISKIAHEKGTLSMTDATQSVGKIPVDVDSFGVDILCFSGHKMYAPKGTGALYARQRGKKVKLNPQIHGGGHEQGLRSGTLNVPGILALAKAFQIAHQEMSKDQVKISELRNNLEFKLLNLPNISLNGDSRNRIFNITNICFFYFFQQKIEWVWLYEHHPELYKKAIGYEKDCYTWVQTESLEELIQLERMTQIKEEYIKRMDRKSKGKSPYLVDILDDAKGEGFEACFI